MRTNRATNRAGAAIDALADPTRRSVFEGLREGPRSVGDLARDLPVSRPAVSQHLRVLKDAGLVEDHPEGTRRLYAIRTDGLGDLRAWLDGIWDEALERFRTEAERTGPRAHPRRRTAT